MKSFSKYLFFILQISLILSKTSNADETVKIVKENASKFNDGKFEGFGTSFCWWPNRLGYSDSLSEQSATAFYDKNKGLGLTIIRYNIGGGDDPTHDHITRTDSKVPGYATNPNYDSSTKTYTWDYDWTQDYNQRNVLLKSVAKNREEIIVEAFSNSPPYFMTYSGCSSGATYAWNDNLKVDAYDAFSTYLADVCEHFKTEWNINFQSISPMNEPYTSYWAAYSNKQEGCHFDQGDSQSNIIIKLKSALDKKGLSDIQISATDETSIDTQITSYNKLKDAAKNIVTRIDTHTYGGSRRYDLKTLAEDANKNLWMSEVDGGDTLGTNPGEMGAALWLAKRIITDLNGLLPSSWILWQVIDNHICKDGYDGKQDSGMVDLNGGYWGVAVADHDNDNIILTQKYYAFGQFSRYIRPGYTIISGNDNSVAAYDSEGKKLVIVVINTKGSEKSVDFNLESFSAVGSKVKVIRTSGSVSSGEKWAELDDVITYGKGFIANLKANSVTTYIVEGVEM
jgi:O-glycosyl hydrolase